LFLGKVRDFPTLANGGEELLWVEVALSVGRHRWCHQWLLRAWRYTLRYAIEMAINKDVAARSVVDVFV
jgi:hypothetical protein